MQERGPSAGAESSESREKWVPEHEWGWLQQGRGRALPPQARGALMVGAQLRRLSQSRKLRAFLLLLLILG